VVYIGRSCYKRGLAQLGGRFLYWKNSEE
jgi:hypothetical protein